MCGIAGILESDGAPASPHDIGAMVAELAHRGPDDEKTVSVGSVSLGFRRLALLDRPRGAQPVASADGSVMSVCNGEIYNYRSLRRRLKGKGHEFRSEVDTEVIPHLYEEYGADLVRHLEGQFAFAVYDSRQSRLLLGRDPCGIIPLFYTVADGKLIFASEIKAILRHPAVHPSLDPRGLDQVLALPGLVSPQTMFHGIRSLRPGERIVANQHCVRTERYWDLDYPLARELPPMSASDTARELSRHGHDVRRLLDASVRSRLMADVPVGLYLSGGLDSSLIAGLIGESRLSDPWQTFSVIFPQSDISESGYQQLAAARLPADHHEITVKQSLAIDSFRAMVRHCECPVRESYNVCSLLMSQQARDTSTYAVLSGEGADELFGGYPGYRFDASGHSGSKLNLLERELEREANERMWGVDLRYEQDQCAAQETRAMIYSSDFADTMDDFTVTRQQLVDPGRLVGRHPLHQRSYLDFHLRLSDHLLGDHGDRMAMANGVEVRYPFLARDVIDEAISIPPALMVLDGQEKAVLRDAAAGLVPAEILHRPKFGFRGQTSTDLLLHTDWFEELVSPAIVRRQGYFNPETLSLLIARQRSGTHQVHPHLDTDYLMVAATFALFMEEFGLPCSG
jgi:asparagine synthase (glutamine-hydrolysing)